MLTRLDILILPSGRAATEEEHPSHNPPHPHQGVESQKTREETNSFCTLPKIRIDLQMKTLISGKTCPFPGSLPHGNWTCEMQEIPIQGTSFLDEEAQSYQGEVGYQHFSSLESRISKLSDLIKSISSPSMPA